MTEHSFRIRREQLNHLQKLRAPQQDEEFIECPKCKSRLSKRIVKENYKQCPNCQHLFQMRAEERIRMLADPKSFRESRKALVSRNPIGFPGYEEKLSELEEKTKKKDAIITGVMKIDGREVAIGVLDSSFMMGSMGTVVGEKIVQLAEYAGKQKLPLILYSASGGARMQEGLFSLMQMAKTAAAVERFQEKGGLYISVLTNPTTGGVSASYASLGDIILAEPEALIGFAGPRVIQQTIGETLPEGFQRAEFLEKHGMVDQVVPRAKQREILSRLLRLHETVERGIL